MPDRTAGCVLLADRHHAFTEGVRGLLETEFGTVVMVADKTSLLEAASCLNPEVAVVDLSLAQDGGLDWLRALRGQSADLKIVVLSVHDERSVHEAAMAAGADGFVLKLTIGTDLLPTVDEVRSR
jgi:DNA-binding NarL/FixJ family response regulator